MFKKGKMFSTYSGATQRQQQVNITPSQSKQKVVSSSRTVKVLGSAPRQQRTQLNLMEPTMRQSFFTTGQGAVKVLTNLQNNRKKTKSTDGLMARDQRDFDSLRTR